MGRWTGEEVMCENGDNQGKKGRELQHTKLKEKQEKRWGAK